MKTKVIIISCLILLISTPIYASQIAEFTIMTEEWRPYNFSEDSQIKGISTDILVLILDKIGSKQNRSDIEIYPWARAYNQAQTKANTILYTTARTKARKDLFKWVGPIFKIEFNLWAAKKRNIEINSVADLNQYQIGTLRYDVLESILLTNTNLEKNNLDRVSSNILNTKKLYKNRIDLVATSNKTMVQTSHDLELNTDWFENVYSFGEKSMNFAFHKNTPDYIIESFQAAFDELKANGQIAEIFNKYQN